jgi:hypothetical protein
VGPLYADKSLKYGVGLAVLLVTLIGAWSWHTLRQVSVAPPLPPVQISGSAHPIAVATMGTQLTGDTPTSTDGAPTSSTSASNASSNAPTITPVNLPASQTSAGQQQTTPIASASASQLTDMRSQVPPSVPIAPEPHDSVLVRVLSTVLSLL